MGIDRQRVAWLAGAAGAVLLCLALLPAVSRAAPSADLQLGVTDSPDPVTNQDNLTYGLQVTNNGPDGATGVQVVDTLPSSVAFVSASSGCAFSSSGTPVVQQVTCNVGALANGGTASVQIVVQTRQPGTISNSATVTGSEPDPTPGNNTVVTTTTVRRRFDLSLLMSAQPDEVVLGQVLSYRLSAISGGPDGVTGMTVTDPIPPGAEFVSASPACALSAGSVVCTGSDLGPTLNGLPLSQTQVFSVVLRPTVLGNVTNVATVGAPSPTADQAEPSGFNNSASVTTQVVTSIPRTGPCANRQEGTSHPDTLRGTQRGDRLLGFGAGDLLEGFTGRDCLLGANGNDTLKPGKAGDTVKGGNGNDRVYANDGYRDVIYCGPGRDVALIDSRDQPHGCERLRGPGAKSVGRTK